MRTSPRGTRCHTQPRARLLLGPASSLGIGVQRGQRIRFIEGMGSGGSRHRHRVGWRLRWRGSPRPQAQWRRWSCRSGHSAGRGWRPPHCSPLRVGCRTQGVGGGGWPPPFPPFPQGLPSATAAGLPADSPANLPSGIRSRMVLAFWGSLQWALPMAVITTVGFTAFTRICARMGGNQ